MGYDNERDYMFEGAISERDYAVEQSWWNSTVKTITFTCW